MKLFGLLGGGILGEEVDGFVFGDGFVEVVVDEADGAGAAGGEAFGEFDAELAAGTDGDGVVMAVGLAAVYISEFADFFHQFATAGHGAGEGTAHADVEFAGCVLAEAGVEGDDFEDFDGFEFQFGGYPMHGWFGDVAELVLDEMEQRQNRRTLALLVMRNRLIGFRLKRGGDGEIYAV